MRLNCVKMWPPLRETLCLVYIVNNNVIPSDCGRAIDSTSCILTLVQIILLVGIDSFTFKIFLLTLLWCPCSCYHHVTAPYIRIMIIIIIIIILTVIANVSFLYGLLRLL